MNHGIHQNYLYAAAGTLPERRLSIFRNTLKRAASCVTPMQYTISLGTAVVMPATVFLDSSECSQFHSVLKTSVRGRRVS